jgi:hypothetical protein
MILRPAEQGDEVTGFAGTGWRRKAWTDLGDKFPEQGRSGNLLDKSLPQQALIFQIFTQTNKTNKTNI